MFCNHTLSDLLAVPGEYKGMTRGQVAEAVRVTLERRGLYKGEVEVEEEVLRSKFGDIVYVRDLRDIKREPGDVNLRKPILLVSTSSDGPIVSILSNTNIEASDNKAIGSVGGRTGGFCTGCTATEKDMHGPRASQVLTHIESCPFKRVKRVY